MTDPTGEGPGRASDPSTLEAAVHAAVDLLRTAGEAAGLHGADLEDALASTVAFVRRRLEGDFTVDDFGFDEDFFDNVALPLLRPLYRAWFRVEVRGIENIPAEGGALVVSNHSGTVPLDALMTQLAVHDEHPQERVLRMLGADLVFGLPVVGDLARKVGVTLASGVDVDRLFAEGQLVGVWPEGFKGIGKPFRDRYTLQRFGRGGFVSAALRAGVPIVPCSVVGAEEAYPLLGNVPTLARALGLPYFPLTPTFPWFGLLGAIPLPSKWIIEFGTPITTDGDGDDDAAARAERADDPAVVFELTDRVRESIQLTLHDLVAERGSAFG